LCGLAFLPADDPFKDIEMAWRWLRQQQQRGAQLHRRDARRSATEESGKAPAEAVQGREVQDHDYADLQVSSDGQPQRGIDYPATNVSERRGDITPGAGEPQVNWDDVVQPERATDRAGDDTPLPEGK
jgi:hypothetical protein